jgi:hypothetical protein
MGTTKAGRWSNRGRQTVRRSVIVSPAVRRSGFVRLALWAFGYDDLATLFGMEVASVRRACKPRGGKPAALDPSDLASIVAFAQRQHAARKKKS